MEKDKKFQNNKAENELIDEPKEDLIEIRRHTHDDAYNNQDKPETTEQLYDRLIRTIERYHPSADYSMIEKAYKLSRDAHEGQLRKSGEPYIIHPLYVAIILAEIELDKESIVAGILHDVVEDTHYTLEQVSEMFNPEIASLVDGVTKLSTLSYSHDKVEAQAENLRKMFLAMAKDIRVILIKLADRLHNMRTMEYQTPAKQKEKAKETLEIYAPIAQRLGISKFKVELDDLSLKYLESDIYHDLAAKIHLKRNERSDIVNHIVSEVQEHMDDSGIEAKVVGRIKHFFSILNFNLGHFSFIGSSHDTKSHVGYPSQP